MSDKNWKDVLQDGIGCGFNVSVNYHSVSGTVVTVDCLDKYGTRYIMEERHIGVADSDDLISMARNIVGKWEDLRL